MGELLIALHEFGHALCLRVQPAPEAVGLHNGLVVLLDARALYPDCSLADLYDEVTMPPELRKAHQQNDKAVMQAYGFWGRLNTETECVAELMKRYQQLTQSAGPLPQAGTQHTK